ncbi:MAG: class F sortase [Actinomycetota bacterium]|nr:class F sortase [Actinomycetota bacterium]
MPAWAVAAAGTVLLVAAGAVLVATWPQSLDRGAVPRPPIPAPGTFATGPVLVAGDGLRWAGPLVKGPIRPIRVVVPSAGVDAAVLHETVSGNGQLGVPDDPQMVGWWARGPEPGSARGTAVIDGHVDSATRGIGALSKMSRVTPGQQLAVIGSEGSEIFRIDAVRQLSKTSLVSSGALDQSVGDRLVIITCGGSFNPTIHAYRDNVVVYATPVVGGGDQMTGK